MSRQGWPPSAPVDEFTPVSTLSGVTLDGKVWRSGRVVAASISVARTSQTGVIFVMPEGWRPGEVIFPIIGRSSGQERYSVQVAVDGTVEIVASLVANGARVHFTYIATH